MCLARRCWLRCQPWNSGLGIPSSECRWPPFSLPRVAPALGARPRGDISLRRPLLMGRPSTSFARWARG
eukprot:2033905-Pyramimonas_sp.AAC.1